MTAIPISSLSVTDAENVCDSWMDMFGSLIPSQIAEYSRLALCPAFPLPVMVVARGVGVGGGGLYPFGTSM
jgi:hypothetical protein